MKKAIPEEHADDFIKFLGTAGARFVVIKQLRASGGLWFKLGRENVLVDPGPGSLVKCLASRPKLDPSSLDGIVLTHRHLDHSNDVNVMIEAMTVGGREKGGFLYAPWDALCSEDPVVQHYLRHFLNEVECLETGRKFHRPFFTLESSLKHQHPVETYGLKFHLPYGKVFLLVDTAFFPELLDHYRGADILIINVVIFQDLASDKIYHLNFRQAGEIIAATRPKLAVLTHFGMTILQNKPHLLARELEEKTGCRVMAATDGKKLALPALMAGEGTDPER